MFHLSSTCTLEKTAAQAAIGAGERREAALRAALAHLVDALDAAPRNVPLDPSTAMAYGRPYIAAPHTTDRRVLTTLARARQTLGRDRRIGGRS